MAGQFQNQISKSQKEAKSTQIHDRSLSLFDTGTLINSGGVKLVLGPNLPSNSEMMRSPKYFPHVSKMPTFIYNWANSVIIKNLIFSRDVLHIQKLSYVKY